MSVHVRVGDLLRRRRGAIGERCKSALLAQKNQRDPRKQDTRSLSIFDHLPELLDEMAQTMTGSDSDSAAMKTEMTARATRLVELAGGTSDPALELLHLRAVIYDELHDAWPEMTAAEWWPIEHAIDCALRDVISRSEALREKRLGALEETIRLQDRFFAMLAHDLRSSLNGISGFAQILQRAIEDAKQRRPIERILGIVGRMDRLIGDVLDLARARSGLGVALCFDRVDFNELCRRAVDASKRAHPERVRLAATAGEITIDCDVERMSRAIVDLLVDALARASVGSAIDACVSNVGEEATLTVRYQGPPIPPEYIAQAFDPLRSDRRPADLSLYVARETIVAHGGTIGMDSSDSRETVFTLRIPCRLNRTEAL